MGSQTDNPNTVDLWRRIRPLHGMEAASFQRWRDRLDTKEVQTVSSTTGMYASRLLLTMATLAGITNFVAVLHVLGFWCITSNGAYGHSVFDTFVQLTEGVPPGITQAAGQQSKNLRISMFWKRKLFSLSFWISSLFFWFCLFCSLF